MASTRRRWINVSGISIGGTSANDNVSVSFSSGSDKVGSSSENDNYDNHFLQAVQKADSVTCRFYDIAAAVAIRGFVGSVKKITMTVNAASQSSTATNYSVSTTTSGGAMVSSVNISTDKDQEAVAEVELVFRSPDGTTSGMILA